MRFASGQFLNLLWLLPVLFAVEFYAAARRRQSLLRLGDAVLMSRLSESLNRRRRRVKFLTLVIAVALLALAAARPQYGTRLRMVERKGIDLVIALDVSKSMLAEDVKPSRLTRARSEIASLIDRLKGDRVGLVAFAGDAFVQCPLTLDYSAVKMLLDAVDVYSVPEPGTNLAKAINVSVSTFPIKEFARNTTARWIISGTAILPTSRLVVIPGASYRRMPTLSSGPIVPAAKPSWKRPRRPIWTVWPSQERPACKYRFGRGSNPAVARLISVCLATTR